MNLFEINAYHLNHSFLFKQWLIVVAQTRTKFQS
jgi:hypothetical protein